MDGSLQSTQPNANGIDLGTLGKQQLIEMVRNLKPNDIQASRELQKKIKFETL